MSPSTPASKPRAFEQIAFGEALPEFAPDVSLANVKRFAQAASMMARGTLWPSITSSVVSG